MIYLFGAYQAISKFMTKEIFVKKMHQAYLDKNLHETVDELTKKIPEMFQDHDWNDVKIVNPVLLLNGNTIQENSIDILLELLDNNFIIECAVCHSIFLSRYNYLRNRHCWRICR